MGYLNRRQLEDLKFRYLGENVRVSDKACIYNPDQIEIGSHSRIDDLCILSGKIVLGAYNHVTPMCLIAGGEPGVFLSDFCTLAYGVKVFSQSDDYSGETLVNSLIPRRFKREIFKAVRIGRQVVVGANATVLPGADVAEGCAIGAASLVLRPTGPWGIYAGVPARRIGERKRDLLALEAQFLSESGHDPV